MKSLTLSLCFFIGFVTAALAQAPKFTRQDTLRGSITLERAWWDLVHYDLGVKADPEAKTFSGQNTVTYKVLTEAKTMQIDLQHPMKITEVMQDGKALKFLQNGNAWFITLKKKQVPGAVNSLTISYGGRPQVSKLPPWEGGVTWAKDSNGNDFIVTTCQGDGASLWWPCKDHMYDETDSMTISVTVPEHLMDVSNGRLRKTTDNNDGTKTFEWFVSNPINNYGVNVNVGDYVHFGEVYQGEKGPLDCDYYVLRDNLKKAKTHFEEVPKMLAAFEYWFGPYPFYQDSYKLVEVPYYGMEHQSSVTYGNFYKNGYHTTDVSGTGWGFNFDFIIVHESGHEWFANNITYKDIADMWVHEGFTAYSENLFVDYYYGKDASAEYVIGTRKNIRNDRPIIGYYEVNKSGSGDMYSKGANMLHTLRQLVNDDEKWRMMLRGLNEEFYHQTVTTGQIEAFLAEKSGMDLKPFFDQYLRDTRIPVLEYKADGKTLHYRWTNCVEGFDMPVEVSIDGKTQRLIPESTWKTVELGQPMHKLMVDSDYYVDASKIE
ncbi:MULTISPECIES: M1 family metallopeptidase [unclassified Imperialibacter]|uniref:M1 family metallopeptidase n=1 Tax=unclassified Imperialibacter TaxID=2629706 RepID=UPI001256E351|nr:MULTISPECIES: M1 family metallopeptidase [unclassified Imperialibacter]CAD5250813.1 M1 family peptidase [Imperialibacter sp. 75]CAD5285623.1 M1 family peptidase [Imperialibacter sp. 89]VVT04848.1 Peptidase family M1 [Imperialibacter sp. EC-SDR9]